MTRTFKLITGTGLILLGGLLLAYNLAGAALGWADLALWRLWPLGIAGVGLLFVLPLVLAPRERGQAALLIPSLLLLCVAGLSAAGQVFGPGLVWAHFWPQVILTLALALGLLALYWRLIWLGLPALVLGLLGAALQLTALTGWWSLWAVLWAVVPLGVGLGLLGIGLVRHLGGLRVAGGLITLVTALVAGGLGSLLTGQWSVLNLTLAVGLMAAGLALALWGRPAAWLRSSPAVMDDMPH